jgi:hypothetical protein
MTSNRISFRSHDTTDLALRVYRLRMYLSGMFCTCRCVNVLIMCMQNRPAIFLYCQTHREINLQFFNVPNEVFCIFSANLCVPHCMHSHLYTPAALSAITSNVCCAQQKAPVPFSCFTDQALSQKLCC